jgi:hypothetical protein
MRWRALVPPWPPAVVYDVSNFVGLASIMAGVGMIWGAGAALIVGGALVMILNLVSWRIGNG